MLDMELQGRRRRGRPKRRFKDTVKEVVAFITMCYVSFTVFAVILMLYALTPAHWRVFFPDLPVSDGCNCFSSELHISFPPVFKICHSDSDSDWLGCTSGEL